MILRVRWCKGCSFYMYASERFQLSGYAPIRLMGFYIRRYFWVRWCKGCRFHMYVSIKAVAVRVCLCKDCSFHMYASINVSVVRVCSYKAGMLL